MANISKRLDEKTTAKSDKTPIVGSVAVLLNKLFTGVHIYNFPGEKHL